MTDTNAPPQAPDETGLAVPAKGVAELGIPIGLIAGGDDPTETAARILDEIAAGVTADDVLGTEAEGLEGLVGDTFTIRGFTYMPSTFDDPSNDTPVEERWPYAVIDAVDEDGARRIITTGARKVIVQLATLKRIGGFPTRARVTSTDLEGGRVTYALSRPLKK